MKTDAAEELARTRDFLSGLLMSYAIPSHTKDVIRHRIEQIDKTLERG